MKKLITLTFALLFTAGIAFGQGTVDVDVSGNSNTADAEQALDPNANQPIEIHIDQAGDNNSAESFQQAGDFNGEYISTIDQSGNNNAASQDVSGSLGIQAKIDQSGSYNDATQTLHFGVDNRPLETGTSSFLVDQSGGAQGTGNTATQIAGRDGQLDAQLVGKIYQSGSSNTATQEMSGDNITFTIDQSGIGNTATQRVNNPQGALSGDSFADISQSGDDNTATALMHNSNLFDVDIDQSGDMNTATVDIQAGLGAINTVDISQSGVGSTAPVNITGDGNDVDINQH